MSDNDFVAQYWPHVAALQGSLARLSEGAVIPIRLRPNADQVSVDREFFGELRAQMYLAGL